MAINNYTYESSGNGPYAAAAAINGSYGHYGNNRDLDEEFPLPPSPGTMEEMKKDLVVTPPHKSQFQRPPLMAAANDADNIPRNRSSKSMDLVADESNVGSLVGQRNESSGVGDRGPTLGLSKSSSLESLQSAVLEASQSQIQSQVPFHRPRPHMVRGRGCNQSFRSAIDKSYEGPSEDDDDLSEQSSGHETPASSSSRQDLDAEDGAKKKKIKGKKKEKKTKGKNKDDTVEDLEKKTKKKGFGLLRFGRKKDDKSKDAAKASKSKLEALSEEELERIPDSRDGYEPRYAEIISGHLTPDPTFIPDVEDDDSDPNYARINNFRKEPSPQMMRNHNPSPAALAPASNQPLASAEELDGLYAKVNKSRPPPARQNQLPPQPESDPRLQGLRREYQQARAAPGYDELDAARRRVLEHDPQRSAPRETRPAHHYEEIDRPYPAQPRRDPYDYPRPIPREPAPYPGHSGRVPLPQAGTQSHQAPPYYPSSPRAGHQQRGPVRQDVPPSPTAGRRGRHYYEAAGGRLEAYRQASPGRYTSPDRYGYREERQPDPRRKNPMIDHER